MTPKEAVTLIRLVRQIAPAQKVDEFTPDAWHPLLEDIRIGDALEAVKRLGRQQPFIAPADIRTEVRKIREERLVNADHTFVFRGDPDNTAEYSRQLLAHRRAIADGEPPPEQPKRIPRPAHVRQIESFFPSPPPAGLEGPA